MSVLFGVLFGLAGGVAALAGLSGMRRVRRLRRSGQPARAMVLPPRAAAGAGFLDDAPEPTMMQYALADGRVVERVCPVSARKAAGPGSARQILVRYDPADPQDILVHVREGWYSDRLFVAVGLLFIAIGIAVAAWGH
jgi:uncharacterized protein DUF3592